MITKVKPRLFLPSVVLLWGAVVSFMALITDYKSLWGMRLLLGISEAVSDTFEHAMALLTYLLVRRFTQVAYICWEVGIPRLSSVKGQCFLRLVTKSVVLSVV